MTRFFSTRFLVMAVFALVLAVGTVIAQPTGGITGVVTDTTGAVVPNATVKLVNAAKAIDKTITTTDDGIYTFTLLEPGKYTVTASAGNFTAQTIEVEVQVGRTTNNNFSLGAGNVNATVEVTAEGIQVTQSNSDAVVNETAIQNLPINGRRFQDFVTLTPTAQVEPSRQQISLVGQKGINGNVSVDGLDYNQPFFGGIRGGERSNLAFTIPQESIKEFQVVASGYTAEYGRSTGGVVNAITKSGSNEFHGSAFGLWRPSRLARGNQFTDALVAQRLAPLGVTPTLAPTQEQWGGSVGGRVIKDKVFYFGSYEGQRFRAPRQIVFNYPSGFPPSGVVLTAAQQAVLNFFNAEQVQYTQTNDAWAALARIDWNITENHKFNVRGNMSRNNALNAASRGETSVDPTTRQSLSTNGTEQDRLKMVVAGLESNFGANKFNEFRFQAAKEIRPRISNSVVPQIVTSFATYGAGGSDTSSFLPNIENDVRYEATDGFTWIKGNHTAKFGGDYSHIFAAQTFSFNPFGQYNNSVGAACTSSSSCTFQTALQNMSNVVVPQSGSTQAFLGRFDVLSTAFSSSYQRQIGNRQAALTVQQLAFYGQDTWRVTPKFTLNYGLRVEQQFNPPGDASNTAVASAVMNTIFPYTGKNVDPSVVPDSGWEWGPRGGFAFDPKGDGRTVFRGYAGLYYAATPLIWIVPVTQTYRSTPADVSQQLPFSGISQSAFDTFLGTAAGTPYKTITGCDPTAAPGTDARNRCNPQSIYRYFAIVGVDLNASPLSNLPQLTNAQVSTIAGAVGLTPSPFVGAQVINMAPDYKNPQSFQWGASFERQLGRGLVFGLDYANVSTHFIGRFRDLNIPSPLTAQQYIDAITAANGGAADSRVIAMNNNGLFAALLAGNRNYISIATPAGFVNCTNLASLQCLPTVASGQSTANAVLPANRLRPTQAQGQIALGSVAQLESTANSLYRGLTARVRWVSKRMMLNAYYTLSRTYADDDNERQNGVGYADAYNLAPDYGLSRLNRTHMFSANPVVFLPWGFEVSSAIRLRSGLPFNETVGGDLNGDGINNDRPIRAGGGGFMIRNAYTNKGIYDIDLRVQKTFKFGETRRLIIHTDLFNIMNRPNLLVSGSAAPSSASSFGTSGQFCVVVSQACGLPNGPGRNANFLQLYDANTGVLNVANVNPGSQVFQMQFGARFNW
ncbi:MAG: TonB-dependent receptor [Acidobacteria bacterium]|nr:TonB-dependent receptor [Acidobacteriota bacterium]